MEVFHAISCWPLVGISGYPQGFPLIVGSNESPYRDLVPKQQQQSAWSATLHTHVVLQRLLEDDLQRDCDMTLAHYDVLSQLWAAPDHRVRMSDLAEATLLSRSWLTRRIDQLESAGLVARSASYDDKRGVYAELTDLGLSRFTVAKASHANSVRSHVTDHLTANEERTLIAMHERLAATATAKLAERSATSHLALVTAVGS